MKLNIFIIAVLFLFIISLITSSLTIKESLTFKRGRKKENVLEMGNLVSKGEQYSLDCEKMCESLSDCKFSIIHNGKRDRSRDNILKGNCYVTQPNISKNEFYQVVNRNLKNNKKFQIKENRKYKAPAFKAKLKLIGNNNKPNTNILKRNANCIGLVNNKIAPIKCNNNAFLEFKPYKKTDYYTIGLDNMYFNDFQKGKKINKPIRCNSNKCRKVGRFKLFKTTDKTIAFVNPSNKITNMGKGWTNGLYVSLFDRQVTFNKKNKTKLSESGNWELLNKSRLTM